MSFGNDWDELEWASCLKQANHSSANVYLVEPTLSVLKGLPTVTRS